MNDKIHRKLLKAGFCGENEDHCLYCRASLEELIEACGKKFGNLALKNWNPQRNNQWIAEPVYEISMEVGEGAGFTPEEAVANLWLSLHIGEKR